MQSKVTPSDSAATLSSVLGGTPQLRSTIVNDGSLY
jgi:hypothetical protein